MRNGIKEIFSTALGWTIFFTYYLVLSVLGVTLIQVLRHKATWGQAFPVTVKWEILVIVFSLMIAISMFIYKYLIQRILRLSSFIRTFFVYFMAFFFAFPVYAFILAALPLKVVNAPEIEQSIQFILILITLFRVNPQRNLNDPEGPVLAAPVSDFIKDKVKPIGYFSSGVDFPEVHGAPVFAAEDGIVRMAWPYKNDGNVIKIAHTKEFSTVYSNLSEIKVNYGQTVKKGDVIGYVGSTGHSFEPHLRFEVRYKNRIVDPMQYVEGLKPKNVKKAERKKGGPTNEQGDKVAEVVGGTSGDANGAAKAKSTAGNGQKVQPEKKRNKR